MRQKINNKSALLPLILSGQALFIWCIGPESNRHSHKDRGILSQFLVLLFYPTLYHFNIDFIRNLIYLSYGYK